MSGYRYKTQAQAQAQSAPDTTGVGLGVNPPNHLEYQHRVQTPIQPLQTIVSPLAQANMQKLKEVAPVKKSVLFSGNVGAWSLNKSATVQELPKQYYEGMRAPFFPIEANAQDFYNQFIRGLELAKLGPDFLDIDTIKYGQGIPLELLTFASLANFNIKKPELEIATLLDVFQLNRWGVLMEGALHLREKLEKDGRLNWENLPYAKDSKCFEINHAFGTTDGSDTFGAINRNAVGIFDQRGLSTLRVASVFKSGLTKRTGDFSGTEVGVECHRPIDIPKLGGIVPSEIKAWIGMYSTGRTELNNDVFEFSLELEPDTHTDRVYMNVNLSRGRLGAIDGIKTSMSTNL
jgi:hypothetical protein